MTAKSLLNDNLFQNYPIQPPSKLQCLLNYDKMALHPGIGRCNYFDILCHSNAECASNFMPHLNPSILQSSTQGSKHISSLAGPCSVLISGFESYPGSRTTTKQNRKEYYRWLCFGASYLNALIGRSTPDDVDPWLRNYDGYLTHSPW